MTATDERLERYLHDRSATLELPHAGLDAITRGARRHRRRRAAAGGGLAVVLLAGGVGVALHQPADDAPERVGVAAPGLVDPGLEWDLVTPQVGLGWSTPSVSDGASVYSLSTSAGPQDDETFAEPPTLYRSDDGSDWEGIGLPDGLYASGLAAAEGSIYAVGTAAAGGDTAHVELATSRDGGASWEGGAVPLDLAAVGDGFPGRVRAVDAEVAVSGGTTVVAATVLGTVDPAEVLPDESDAEGWYQELGGMVGPGGDCMPVGADGSSPTTTAPPSTTTVDEPGGLSDPRGSEVVCDRSTEVRTWAELGLTPEQAAVADGRVHLFASDDGGSLEPVGTQPGVRWANPYGTTLHVADDGWWMVQDRTRQDPITGDVTSAEVLALHSTDGRTWTTVPVATGQGVVASGVVAGRPVVVTIDAGVGAAGVSVSRVEPGGSVTTTDLNDLLELPDGVGMFSAAVGPLGVAVVLGSEIQDATTDIGKAVVTSLDGLGFSRQELPEPEAGTAQSVNGITITPDAIKVRLNVRDEDDLSGGEPLAQRLFVGTPR